MPTVTTAWISAALVALALALGAAPLSAETPTTRFHSALDVSSFWNPGLELELAGGSTRVHLDEQIHYRVSSDAPAHVVVVHLDPHGVARLLGDGSGLQTALLGRGAVTDLLPLQIPAPAGRHTAYAVASRRPIDVESLLGLAPGDEPTLDRERAARFAEDLGTTLGLRRLSGFAVARLELDVVGGPEVEYTVEQVVAQLIPTRSVPRPRIDFHKVLFGFDSVDLTDVARRNLDVVGQALGADALSSEIFVLGGHTDAIGDDGYNDALSERRAEAARAYLLEKWQIEPGRILARGYGEQRPLITGDEPDAQALNRRVELEVIR